MLNKITVRYYFISISVATIKGKKKKQKTTSVGKDVEKLEPCALLVGVKMLLLLWGKAQQLLQELNIEMPYVPAIPLLGYTPRSWKEGPKIDAGTPLLFTVAQRQRRPEGPSVDEWDSTWSVQPYEGKRC